MKKSIPYIIIAIMALLWFQQYNNIQKQTLSNTEALNDTIKYYKNTLGTVTASKKTLQVINKRQALELLNNDNEIKKLTLEFSKVNNIVKIESVTNIPEIKIPFQKPISNINFEKKGKIKEKHYSFNYYFNKSEFILDSLNILNKTTVITGFKRKWFLGKQTLITDVTNSNPYITVTDIKATEVIIPEPWYKKWYVWLATGFIGSIFFTK